MNDETRLRLAYKLDMIRIVQKLKDYLYKDLYTKTTSSSDEIDFIHNSLDREMDRFYEDINLLMEDNKNE